LHPHLPEPQFSPNQWESHWLERFKVAERTHRIASVVSAREAAMRIIVIGLVLMAMASAPVLAQTPIVQVYFDDQFTAASDCPPGPIGTVVDTLYVYAQNFNMFMSAIDFSVSYPPQVSWLADTPMNNGLMVGNTPGGAAIAWSLPQNGFAPVQVCRVLVTWQCDACIGNEDAEIVVGPYFNQTEVRATRWPDNVLFTAIGMRSLICATVPVESTSWGKVKALYQ